MADDFIANASTIENFCFSPKFHCFCASCVCNCNAPEENPPPDRFFISFHADGGDDDDPETPPGFSGTLRVGSPVGPVTIADKAFQTCCGYRCWDYSVVFDPPIEGLIIGRRYWVELSGVGERYAPGHHCEVIIGSSLSGNGWALYEDDLFGTRRWNINDVLPWKEVTGQPSAMREHHESGMLR